MKEEEEHGPRGAFASAVDGDRCVHHMRCCARVAWRCCGPFAACSRASARSDDEETAGLDAEKLRVYERERLRFYYAIVECDSAATAASLYKQCDGLVRPPALRCVSVPAERGAHRACALCIRLASRSLSGPPRAWICATCRTSRPSPAVSLATSPLP